MRDARYLRAQVAFCMEMAGQVSDKRPMTICTQRRPDIMLKPKRLRPAPRRR